MRTDPARSLLQKLARELHQEELSALTHSRREAERLGDTPPAVAMMDVAHHADAVAKILPALFESRSVGSLGLAGAVFGRALSLARRFGVDWLLGTERSYRMTLLGQRHGIDLVYELEHLALELKDEQLTEWCRGWLERRVPLVTAVEQQLQWFVAHPDRAVQGA